MGPVAVALIQNEAATYANYRLSSTNWSGNAISSEINDRPEFNNYDLGECTQLLIDGAAITCWADGNDYYTTESYRLHYRVYAATGTAGDWSAEMPIDYQAYREGNNYRYHVTGKNIDVLALVNNVPGTYKLDVQYLAKKFWNNGTNGGDWTADGDVCTASFTIPAPQSTDPTVDRSFYFDFGVVGRENAAAVANPDGNGNYWNNIGAEVTANPWKVSATADYTLVTAANATTTIHMGYTGDLFLGNGAGGCTSPDATALGDLAVVNATRDYLFASNSEKCGLVLSGLDPDKAYQFKIFGSRSATDTRVSKYDIEGLTNTTGQLQAAGSNIGGSGVNQNVANVYLSDKIFPDKDKKITIYVSKGTSGQYLPINCMRMQEFSGVEKPATAAYEHMYLKGTGVEDNNIEMHMLAKEGVTESKNFETFCTLTNGGTIVVSDGTNDLYSGTVSVETGIYRVQFNSDNATPVLTKINRIGCSGNVTSYGWSNTGEEMVYQGHGVWQKTFTFTDFIGSDQDKRICWYINSAWNPTISCLKGHEKSVVIADDVDNFGLEKQNVRASAGEHLVTLDLRNFTYSFDCTDTHDNQITFFGSSVCSGEGASVENNVKHGYAWQYMQNHTDYTYVNNSINGNTTIKLLERFYGHMETACTEYLVIGLGLGNEGLHGAADQQAVYNQWKTNMQLLISKAQNAGAKVVVTNNYPRGDYNEADYGYAKQMNIEMNTWGVPVVNFLGALDNCAGNGQWAEGYQNGTDIYHPTEAGHYEFACAMVPSLFDALAAGKTIPTFTQSAGTDLTAQHVAFTPAGVVHPFTLLVRVKATATEDVTIGYITTNNGQVAMVLPAAKADGEWHTYALTHYYAAGKSYAYIDGVQTASEEGKLILSSVTLGDVALTAKELMFYRSAMNADEIAAVHNGTTMIHASLDLYCPLDNGTLTNVAQSTAEITLADKAVYFYVVGNGATGNSWCDGKFWTVDGSLLSEGTITFTGVPAGEYQFKVTDGSWGAGHEFTTIDTENSQANIYGGNGNNILFELGETADVTIAFDGTDIAVTATKPFLPRYFVAGDGEEGKSWCDGKNWNVAGSKMTNGSITFTNVEAGKHQFKLTDGNWGAEHEFTTLNKTASSKNVFVDGNIFFTLAETANVTITFDGEKITVTTTGSFLPRYYLTGSGITGLNWGTKDMAMDNDEITLTNLPVSTANCEIKVTDGTWSNVLGYSNVDAENSSKGYYLVGNQNNLGFWVNYPCDVTIKVVDGKIQLTGDFVKLYVAGNGTSDANGNWVAGHDWWTTGGVALPANCEVSFSNVAPGTYKFKFASADWGVKYFDLDQANSNVELNSEGNEGDKNIQFTLAAASDVTIRMSADHKGSVNVTPLPEQITISSYGYATYYNSAYALALPAGLTAYVAAGVVDDALDLQTIDVIPAATGVLLEGAAGQYDLTPTTTTETVAANLFQGTDTDTEISNSLKHYILSTANGNFGFFYPNGLETGVGAFTNKAHKAYVEIPDGVTAPTRGFVLRRTATKLESTQESVLPTKVLIDGTIYILRSGAMYNLNGQLVK